ncbi:hypothetical protein ABC974_08495 [Sphingomonas oligophenolica]|uniref:DUF1127 domain-containing protein n=1 Tax=Sphingomonas oligophenolica TaxID=301154 RepID=A0ABU9Y1H6_9SPHN
MKRANMLRFWFALLGPIRQVFSARGASDIERRRMRPGGAS